ncbi:MAG: hypothetical protein AAGD07_08100 [Planctomycetota bacterium]
MKPMDKLFALYNAHIDQLERTGHELNALYPESATSPIRRKTREQFEAYLLGPPSDFKRETLLRLVGENHELLRELPSPVQSLIRQAA